jgi:hypothetical protein
VKNTKWMDLGEECMSEALLNGCNGAIDEALTELLKLYIARKSDQYVDADTFLGRLYAAGDYIDRATNCFLKYGSADFLTTEFYEDRQIPGTGIAEAPTDADSVGASTEFGKRI